MNRLNKKLMPSFIITVLLFLLVLPVIVKAQAAPPIDIVKILNNIKTVLFWIFDGLVVIMVVWAGVLYLVAHGDPSKVQAANKALVWALVGVAVGLLANFASGFVNWLIS